jgi:hypothetical protein
MEAKMTRDEEECSLAVIEFCRTHFRKLGVVEFAKIGARPEDISIGAIYAAFDLAEGFAGDGVAALEWLRTGLDLMERQVLAGEEARCPGN